MSSIRDYHQYKPRFNTAFTFAFDMNHWFEDDDQLLDGSQIRAAILHSLSLRDDEDIAQACLCDPFDTVDEPFKERTWTTNEYRAACHTDPTEEWPEGAPTSLPDELKE